MTTPQDPHSGQEPNAADPWQGGAPQTGGPEQQGGAPQQPDGPQPGQYPQSGAYPPPSTPTPPSTPPDGQQVQQPGRYPQQPGQYPQQPGQYPPPSAYPPPSGAPMAGQPAPGQPMPGQPAPGQAGEPAKKSNTPRIVIAVVVVLAVVLGGVLYFVNRQSDPAAASVGDCIKVVDDSATDAELERLSCDEPDALYKVTASGTSEECDVNENVYTEETDDGDLTTKLCLQPNVSDGECVRQTNDGGNGMEKVSCADTKGDDEVVKVAAFDHTTSDESVCPEGSFPAITYQTHPGVLCITENN